ncbi:MAG: YbhB/YbcL family Raf kinase inhibitor-like protein [Micavibrio aeruginosavorus]|nr:YbhB/YbcL family Raf kinase inhibitor-like protein [Micavibrio aeruginosavorus]
MAGRMFDPENTKRTLVLAFGIAVLAVVAVVFVLKGTIHQPKTATFMAPPQIAAVPEPATTPVPAAPAPFVSTNRDMLEDTAAASAPVAAKNAVAPAPTAAPLPFAGNGELQIGKIAGTLKVSAPDVPTERLPLTHTCYRAGTSPALLWTGAPSGTKSFVVLFEKDETQGANILHWALYGIPAAAKGLPAAIPVGAALTGGMMQAQSDIGQPGYIGPCDPRGQFMYQFRVFALDNAPGIAAGASKAELYNAMNGHILDMAILPMVHYYKM